MKSNATSSRKPALVSDSQTFSAEDRVLLRDSVSRFVSEQYPFEFRRRVLGSTAGYSDDIWREMSNLGLLGLAISPEHGGVGGGHAEVAIVSEAIGRALVLEPYLGTAVIGASLISTLGTAEQRQRLLDPLVRGDLILALAHAERTLGFAREPVTTTVQATAQGLVLKGSKVFALDAPIADLILVTAAEAGGLSLFAVPRDASNLQMKPWRTVDGRRAADLVLDGVPVSDAQRLGNPGEAAEALDLVLDLATLAVGAEGLGAMCQLLDATREYLCTRKQFGRPLAQFQVLQHRLVDMLMLMEESRAVLQAARRCLAANRAQRHAAVSVAKIKVSEAARFVGAQAIQLHGAIGMTDELPVSHFFKRLLMVDAMFGNSEFHVARFRAATQDRPPIGPLDAEAIANTLCILSSD